jgi:solute:Na+ symporter, SSS family
MLHPRHLFIIMTVILAASGGGRAEVADLRWENLPPLPPGAGESLQPGVAGPFAGIHGGALLVAGGANFPDKMPWDGGAKKWRDDIWVLEDVEGAAPHWNASSFKLPRALGYGVSVSTPDGVVCAGGSDAARCYADVFLLSWDARARQVKTTPYPPMPEPLAFMAGALVGQTLYVAGGQKVMQGASATSAFWSLDLSKRNQPAAFKWVVEPTWPGPARIVPVGAAQRTAEGPAFFLFSGRFPVAGKPTAVLTDAFAFHPQTRTWEKLPPIGGGRGVSAMAGTAAPVGQNEILLIGGDRADLFVTLENHDLAVEALRTKAAAAPAAERAALEQKIADELMAKKRIYDSHPGFGRDVLAYDTLRRKWRTVVNAPHPPQVTTIVVPSGNSIIIPSGEVKPGVRTKDIMRVTPVQR